MAMRPVDSYANNAQHTAACSSRRELSSQMGMVSRADMTRMVLLLIALCMWMGVTANTRKSVNGTWLAMHPSPAAAPTPPCQRVDIDCEVLPTQCITIR